MASDLLDARVNELVNEYFESQDVTPNWYNYEKADLSFNKVKWNDRTPRTDKYQGITRSVTVVDQTDSKGKVSVTVGQAAVSVRIHLIAGRLAVDEKKLVTLKLPKNDVFKNFGAVQFDANKEKSDAIQKLAPITVMEEDLSTFRKVNVTSSTSIYEGNFECTAVLEGKLILEGGELPIGNIVDYFGRKLPKPFSSSRGTLTWPVRGMAEFILDSETRVH